jgi:hypothetical protein
MKALRKAMKSLEALKGRINKKAFGKVLKGLYKALQSVKAVRRALKTLGRLLGRAVKTLKEGPEKALKGLKTFKAIGFPVLWSPAPLVSWSPVSLVP